jgi:RNA 2',3'-cyclic 3'-phosphodiesterase
VSQGGSVGADERLRLFCGLRLPDDVLDAVVAWQAANLTDARAVARRNLHVTLAFLGSRPRSELAGIVAALRGAAAAAGPIVLEPDRYRETRAAGMLVLGDREGRAAALAGDLQRRLGIDEGRPWLPHLTVVRYRERPGLRIEPPATGPFAPSDAAAFLSRLSPSGAQYEVLESVALGG